MITFVLLVAGLLAVYLGLAYILKYQNLKKPYRFLQSMHVAAAVAYSLAASVAFIIILGAIDSILSRKIIEDIVLEGVPAKAYSAAFMLLIVLLGNIIYMAGAVVVAWICKMLSRRRREFSDNAAGAYLEGFANKYYEAEEYGKCPCIRTEHILTSKWLNTARMIILCSFAVWVALACIGLYAGSYADPKNLLLMLKYFFIVVSAAYFPVVEMHYFLDGVSRYDDVPEMELDEIGFERKGRYDKFIPYFQKKYRDMIANNNRFKIEKAGIEDYMINDVGNQMFSRSNNENAFRSIMNSVKYNCDRLSETYKEATLCLADGESIIVNDSIYGEILLYIAGFVNNKLATGCKVLIVTSYRTRINKIKDELTDRLSRINDLDPIWKVSTIEDNWVDTADILICSVDKLEKISNLEFLSRLGCVIIDDPSGSSVSAEVAQRMSYMTITGVIRRKDLQYIFLCNEDNRNLEESLEHIIGHDLKPFKSVTAKNDFYCIVWKNESFVQPQTRIGVRPYLGNASVIAVEAANAGVKSIGIWVDGTVPYITYHDMMMQNIEEIQQRFLKKSSINMDNVISYNASENYRKGLTERALLENREDNRLKFIIEYDVDNNLLAVVKCWSNYALDINTLIVVVSDSYMLRGYFAENLTDLVHSPSMVKQIIPSKGEDVHRSNELLILRLFKGMKSDELIDAYNSFNATSFRHDQIEDCLEELLADTCPPSLNTGVYNCFEFSVREDFVYENNDPAYKTGYNIKLTKSSIYSYIKEKTNYAVTRFGSADIRSVLPIETEDIYLKYLPNQIHCFDGELAVIKEISSAGELLLEKTTPQNVTSYAQIARYQLNNTSEEKRIIHIAGRYELGEINADLCWDISGFYNFKNGSRLYAVDEKNTERETFEKTELPKTVHVERRNKDGIVIRLQQKTENKEKVELTLALMLNELFKTVLPENYHEISAFVIRTEEMNSILNGLPEKEKVIADTIPSLSVTGARVTNGMGYPEIVLFEKSYSDKGLISECVDEVNLQNILDILYAYLKWESSAQSADNRFLLYGFDDYPSLFDIPGTLAFLESVRTPNDEEESSLITFGDDLSDVCPYCGRHLGVEYSRSTDGRYMCVDCRNQVIQSRSEISGIYKDASDKLKQYYNLGENAWTIRKISFKDLNEIKRKTGNDQILGYYDYRTRDLLVLKGLPKAFEFSTFVHELVHAWQHQALNLKPKEHRDMAEGHAMWVEIEMCRKEHQDAYADYLEYCLEHDLIYAEIDDGNGNKTRFSYSTGYKEMKRRMRQKSSFENSFDVARKWFEEIS